MKAILNLTFFLLTANFFAQEQSIDDQNPNHKISYEKYVVQSEKYTAKQGTTEDQTYVAIDPMEEKRVRKNIHKNHRAMRYLWRHEERLERAKNTRYYSGPTNYGLYSSVHRRGFGLGFSNFGWGISPFFGGSYYIR